MWLGKHAIDQPCIFKLVKPGDAEVVQCINLFHVIALASLAKCFEYLILPRPALCRNQTVCQWSTSCDISLIYRHGQAYRRLTTHILMLCGCESLAHLRVWKPGTVLSYTPSRCKLPSETCCGYMDKQPGVGFHLEPNVFRLKRLTPDHSR
jgi:hypothetical protein